MADIEESLKAQLMNEYGSALEIATLLAIISDYDLTDRSQFEAARRTLEPLKQSSKEEEESGFDASASSGADALLHNGEENGPGENDRSSGKSFPGWSSTTDDTSLSQDISILDAEGLSESYTSGEDTTYVTQLQNLDQSAKESTLIEMFPSLKPFDVKWTLQKYKWDVNKAINDLMTQLFMEENGSKQRGVAAFSETDLPSQARKRKGKKKRAHAADDMISPHGQVSKWDTGKKDVEFVATRVGKSIEEITSLYHQNGASTRATIEALLETQSVRKLESHDPLDQTRAIDLGYEFPSIPPQYLEALIQITQPSTTSAHELAEVLVFHPRSKNNIKIEFRHAPIEAGTDPPKTKSKSHDAVHPSNSSIVLNTATSLATKYTEERNTAFIQARLARRKAKSDYLMGGAAAYYSDVGRTADSRARSAQSAAADALVAGQSSRTELDLHGVNVREALRITKERVTGWWHELGESRMGTRSGDAGYKIVTGVGYHSEGGKGKLAPAVLKMLIKDGWNVQVATGVLVVTGIAKKK